jgi:hypothetical protein
VSVQPEDTRGRNARKKPPPKKEPFKPLSREEIAALFGQAYIIMEEDPALKAWFLDFAKRYNQSQGKISFERFNLELNQQDWWKTNSATYIADRRRELENPTDYRQGLESDVAALRAQARQLGAVNVDDATLENLVKQQRRLGLNAEQLLERLNDFIVPIGDDFRGQAGAFQAELVQWARMNGLSLRELDVQDYVRQMTTGRITLDDVKDDLRRTYLAGMYPAWSDKINEGFDPSALFAPYRNAAANLLELEDLDLNDPIMKLASQHIGADGKPSQLPLWEFEKQVRQDPRWQQTDNAYATYMDVGTNLLKMFGFR